jgi:hypothetical protein
MLANASQASGVRLTHPVFCLNGTGFSRGCIFMDEPRQRCSPESHFEKLIYGYGRHES